MSVTERQISREQFQAYLDVRDSGVTNMWAVSYVCELSRYVLQEDDCLYIMKHFGELMDRYNAGTL